MSDFKVRLELPARTMADRHVVGECRLPAMPIPGMALSFDGEFYNVIGLAWEIVTEEEPVLVVVIKPADLEAMAAQQRAEALKRSGLDLGAR